MSDTVMHMVGHVGTDVDHRTVGSGTDLSTFRLASTPRRWDRHQRQYVDGKTSWIAVQCWRTLALNVSESIRRGDPVIVIGKLKTEEWTSKEGVRNSRFVLDAIAVGHDLNRGVGSFRKVIRQADPPVDDSQEAVEALEDIERDGSTGFDDVESEEVQLRDAS